MVATKYIIKIEVISQNMLHVGVLGFLIGTLLYYCYTSSLSISIIVHVHFALVGFITLVYSTWKDDHELADILFHFVGTYTIGLAHMIFEDIATLVCLIVAIVMSICLVYDLSNKSNVEEDELEKLLLEV